MAVSSRIAKLLAKKYKKKLGTQGVGVSKIKKQLGKTKVSAYMAKDGGYIVKKRKTTKKK